MYYMFKYSIFSILLLLLSLLLLYFRYKAVHTLSILSIPFLSSFIPQVPDYIKIYYNFLFPIDVDPIRKGSPKEEKSFL